MYGKLFVFLSLLQHCDFRLVGTCRIQISNVVFKFFFMTFVHFQDKTFSYKVHSSSFDSFVLSWLITHLLCTSRFAVEVLLLCSVDKSSFMVSIRLSSIPNLCLTAACHIWSCWVMVHQGTQNYVEQLFWFLFLVSLF